MSKAEVTADPASALDETEIAAYLRNHPDFLHQHPQVLAALNLHHESGAAASLIERQVALLRAENRDLQSRLNEFMQAARSNEQRVTQLNSLARALVAAGELEELVSGLTDCVQREMGVDAVFIGLQAQREAVDRATAAGMHALADDDPCMEAVNHVFRRGKPICGPLSATQAQTLFADREPLPASAAMVPLGRHGVHGALVLASIDAEHFVADMGTLFLELMGELVTTALRRHLGSDSLA